MRPEFRALSLSLLPACLIGTAALAHSPTRGLHLNRAPIAIQPLALKTRGGVAGFVDPLPIPPRIVVHGPSAAEIQVKLTQFKMRYYAGLPETTVWGYNGSSPGPTIEVDSGTDLTVHWVNQLPTKPLLPMAPVPGMAGTAMTPMPAVRNVTHLHGAVVTEPDPMDRLHNNDGWPDAWNVPGQEQIAEYPNPQSARILWYHDHAMSVTAPNVYAGLEGMYLIHDDYERSLNLPSGKFEIPLIFQARGFNSDGSLYYPTQPGVDFYGNAIAVNGKIWPYLDVEPRKYRFRILNGSNSRELALKLIDLADSSPGPEFHEIGTGSGFLSHDVVYNDPADPDSPRLTLAAAERADVVIDFSKYAGRTLLLHNNSLTDVEDGEIPLPNVMVFKVGTQLSQPDSSSLPTTLKPIPRLDPSQVSATRRITFSMKTMPGNAMMMLLNGARWNDPITERPVLGTTEVWELLNPLPDTHPFHIHLVEFQILDRRPIDVAAYQSSGQVVFTGPAEPPLPGEDGWKDTVRALPGMLTRIIMRFGPFPGYYVYHCHILEHEDMDMMRPFEIVAPPTNGQPPRAGMAPPAKAAR